MEKIPGLPANFMRRYAKGALSAIRKGLAVPKHCLPAYPRTPRPPRNLKKQAKVKRLKTWRDKKAKELGLEPGILCSNALLDAVAARDPKTMEDLEALPAVRRWQLRVLGKEMIRAIHENR
jgi:ribonuclease D